MLVLGIESTCDESAASVVRDGREILSNVLSSQTDLHDIYGGVVPELASRRHAEVMLPMIEQALADANVSKSDINLIGVAHGPGLIGSILVGLTTAKGLALGLDVPLVGVNHVEAHMYACLMSTQDEVLFPALGVVVSGGHTSLVRIDGLGKYTYLGQTVDDAIGEAFDKVARILGLPYPGGPVIERLALKGDPSRFSFKSGTVKGRPLDFSFSGLKTAVLYAAKGVGGMRNRPLLIDESEIPHVAAAFQEAALQDVAGKAALAAQQYGCKSIVVGGGVSHNQRLRVLMAERCADTPIYWPGQGLSLDNAAMIAGLAYHKYQELGPAGLDLEAVTRIPLAG